MNKTLLFIVAGVVAGGFGVFLSVSHAKNSSEPSLGKIIKAPAAVTATEEIYVDYGENAKEPGPTQHLSAKASEAASNAEVSPAPEIKLPERAPTSDAPPSPVQTSAVEPEKSLRWLTNGNIRYTERRLRADGRSAADRKRLTEGQHPHAIVLACADSYAPPEIIFDQALGEIFTVRVFGQALDSSVVSSIEQAVEKLGVRLLVILGHTRCEAIKGALASQPTGEAISSDLERVFADIRPRLKRPNAEKFSEDLGAEAALNADGVGRDLLQRSALLRKKVESGNLVIKSALYRLDSGKVTFY